MLDVNLLPAQQEFLTIKHEYKTDIACYQGGYGSGKTFSGSLLGVLLCLTYPGIKGLVGAQTFPLLRDTTLEQWFKHLDNAGLKRHKDWTYNVTTQRLKFKNGSEVFFRHFEEPGKLRSLEVGFIQIEEMSQIPESTFLELTGRLRQTEINNGKKLPMRRMFGHTNPEASKGWIWKYFVEKTKKTKDYKEEEIIYERDGRIGRNKIISKVVTEELDGEKHSIQYRLIIAPTTQNIYLPKEQIANMKAIFDAENYNINVLGNFGDYNAGLVTKGFNEEVQVLPLHYVQGLPLHLSCDFNKDPNCWFVCQIVNDNIHFLDEIVLENTTTHACIIEFIKRYPAINYPQIIINGDASGAWSVTSSTSGSDFNIMVNILRQNGYQTPPFPSIPARNPYIDDRINAWNAKICNANGEHSILLNCHINDVGEKIPATPRLLHTINNLKFHPGTGDIDKPTKAALKKDRNLKFDEHVFDAASYIVAFYYPVRREVPKQKQRPRPPVDDKFNMSGEI